MTETELEALIARVAELEARQAPPAPEPPMQLFPARYVPTPATTTTLALMASSGVLRRLTIREVRQLAVAVALARGDLLPGAEVPVDYEPVMVRLAEARASGLGWRAALEQCGLEVPDADEVAHQARTLRGELRGLWDGVEPVLAELEHRLPNWQSKSLFQNLRRLFV